MLTDSLQQYRTLSGLCSILESVCKATMADSSASTLYECCLCECSHACSLCNVAHR